MFYLLLAILTSSLIIVTFRIFDRLGIDNIVAITVNYLVATILGYWLCSETSDLKMVLHQEWILLAVISGFLLMGTFLVYAYSTQRSGVAITSVSGKMSVVIPVLLGFIWYSEAVTWNKIPAILLALGAFVLIFLKKGEQPKRAYYLFPILLFFGNGLNDAVFKIAEQDFITNDYIFFLATAFAVSLIFGLCVLGVKSAVKKKLPDWKSILAGIWLGVLNWYSTYFFLMGLHYFDVSVFVPIFNVSIVMLGALTGFLIFKEKLRPLNWVGVVLAIAAITLLAF